MLEPEEVSHDALLSYYVDYYLAEVTNAGFAQFVYNTGWKPRVVALVKDRSISGSWRREDTGRVLSGARTAGAKVSRGSQLC